MFQLIVCIFKVSNAIKIAHIFAVSPRFVAGLDRWANNNGFSFVVRTKNEGLWPKGSGRPRGNTWTA